MDQLRVPKGKTLKDLLTEGDEPLVRIDPIEFLSVLTDGLWHTTSPARYQGILESGAILPEPPIPDSERWKTAAGPKYYPFARFLGGVSLFDFKGFDPELYEKSYPLSSWREFVPYRHQWGAAVWIEIDRVRAAKSVIGAKELRDKWDSENAHGHTIMPMLEAAHIGAISLGAILRAIRVDGKTGKIEALPPPKI